MTLYYQKSFLTGICLAILIVSINSLPQEGIVFPQLINSGHAFVFFVANFFLLKILYGESATIRQMLVTAMVSILIGFLIECIQPYVGRDRSLLDFFYDIVGVVSSCILYKLLILKHRKAIILLLGTFLCIALAFPVARMVLWWRINQSAVLLNFERNWEDSTYQVDKGVSLEKIPAFEPFTTLGYVSQIDFGISDSYLGLSLDYPKTDWSNYSTLSWEIVSLQEQPISMSMRIHDASHNQEYKDRFNYQFTILPGYNRFEVALNDVKSAPAFREMNMSKIRSLKLFLTKPKEKTTIYLDNIQLN